MAGVAINASVPEESASKFLYNFDVVPPVGDPADPKVIFQSVYYARSLDDVMDKVIHAEIQGMVCQQMAARSLDDDNAQANQIMDLVRTQAVSVLANVGIKLDFIGWGDTFTFDPDVQKAINDRYRAAILQPSLPTLQALAALQVQEGLGAGLTLHGLPQVITPQLLPAFTNGFGSALPMTPNSK